MSNLVTLALNAPLVAVLPNDRTTQHAATMETITKAWDLTPVESENEEPRVAGLPEGVSTACGESGAALLNLGGQMVPWPVRISTLPEGVRRCKACHAATGRMRPRCEIRASESSTP